MLEYAVVWREAWNGMYSGTRALLWEDWEDSRQLLVSKAFIVQSHSR